VELGRTVAKITNLLLPEQHHLEIQGWNGGALTPGGIGRELSESPPEKPKTGHHRQKTGSILRRRELRRSQAIGGETPVKVAKNAIRRENRLGVGR
jgi:hypothetical protein